MTSTKQSYIAIVNDRTSSEVSLPNESSSNDVSHEVKMGSFAVVAPCDMDEGYTFMVTTNGGFGDDDVIPVTVPPGGIRQGQLFYSTSHSRWHKSRIPSFTSSSTTLKIGSISSNISEWTPLMHQQSDNDLSFGKWKDQWFDCFRLGFCHVTVWNAFCCPQILAAQVMSRLQLNWLGDPVVKDVTTDRYRFQRTISENTGRQNFHRVAFLLISYWCLTTVADPNHLPGPTSLLLNNGLVWNDFIEIRRKEESYTLYYIVNAIFGMYTILLLTRLRYHTRRIHRIPSANSCIVINQCQNGEDSTDSKISISEHEDIHTSVEDCCMALCCGSCSVAQMARQTASYYDGGNCSTSDDYQYSEHAVCCSIDGLPQPLQYKSNSRSNLSSIVAEV